MNSRENSEQNVSADVGNITLLFCDIVDFDSIVREYEKDVIKILDSIFRNFDYLCNDWGCQKIETVSKQYVACSGLKWCPIKSEY